MVRCINLDRSCADICSLAEREMAPRFGIRRTGLPTLRRDLRRLRIRVRPAQDGPLPGMRPSLSPLRRSVPRDGGGKCRRPTLSTAPGDSVRITALPG